MFDVPEASFEAREICSANGSLTSIVTDKFTQPKITYYANEKKNAIATKITDKVVQTVQTTVNQQYVETVVKLLGNVIFLNNETLSNLYQKTKDVSVIEEFLNSACVEMEFWKFDRITSCGLNQWGCGWTKVKCDATWSYVDERVGGLTEQEKKLDKIKVSQSFYAIAESGWDINVRYRRKGFRFDSLNFASIDLNSILYDAEIKIAEMAKVVKNDELCNEFVRRSNQRKELMNKLMKDKKSGIYYDYCFKDKKISKFLSAASLYPYAVGISTDKKSAKEIFDRLDFKYGLSTCEYRGEDQYLQWDYPHMWPSNVYITYLALKNTGNFVEARELKKKYLDTVERVFKKTGKLWEKYNSVTGNVSTTIEYETPPMMGWTAAIYEFLYNEKE